MKTLDKITNQNFPLTWANLDSFTESKGHRLEIYLFENENLREGLILMFYTLFRTIKDNIKIFNASWWDYCLDTWDVKEDKDNYELDGKSIETKNYLIMLKESFIEPGYSGICSCNDWNNFLSISLTCILTHIAPYSPIFFDEKNDFFFYFHHTGSIGFYYKMQNEVVGKIINTMKSEYGVR